MGSKMFFVLILSILQCGLVMSAFELRRLYEKAPNLVIPVSELFEEMQQESDRILLPHYSLMAQVGSYGDRLYNVSKDLSLDSYRTLNASMETLGTVAVCEEANRVIELELKAALSDVKRATQLEEHPLELFCRRLEKSFSQNAILSVTFEKAKKKAAKFDFVSSRQPYSRQLLKSGESMLFKYIEMWTVPELARLVAVSSFANQTDDSHFYSQRIHYFVKSCQAVAKSERFADSMQSIYEKVLDEIVPEISANDRVQRLFGDLRKGGTYWVPKMMKTFYRYIASDANLKKELENVVASIGKGAAKEDLDFSKL